MKLILGKRGIVGSLALVLIATVAFGLTVYSFEFQIGQLQSQVAQLQSQTKFTSTYGIISKPGFNATNIFFDGQDGETLSAATTYSCNQLSFHTCENHYQVYLKTAVSYGVRVYFSPGGSCVGRMITPMGLFDDENFNCWKEREQYSGTSGVAADHGLATLTGRAWTGNLPKVIRTVRMDWLTGLGDVMKSSST